MRIPLIIPNVSLPLKHLLIKHVLINVYRDYVHQDVPGTLSIFLKLP